MQPGRWGDGRRGAIGLLGGSFNPAHAGHRHVAEQALKALRLSAVWLLVSPGNPLKPRAGMAPFQQRLASARRIAGTSGRILATGLEAMLGTRYTVDTLAILKRRFPHVRFVLVIGADNLQQLPRWRRWRSIARHTPLAVVPRPGTTRAALAGRAAHLLAPYRRRPGALLAPAMPSALGHISGAARQERLSGGTATAPQRLGGHAPWTMLMAPEHPASATAIRQAAPADWPVF